MPPNSQKLLPNGHANGLARVQFSYPSRMIYQTGEVNSLILGKRDQSLCTAFTVNRLGMNQATGCLGAMRLHCGTAKHKPLWREVGRWESMIRVCRDFFGVLDDAGGERSHFATIVNLGTLLTVPIATKHGTTRAACTLS